MKSKNFPNFLNNVEKNGGTVVVRKRNTDTEFRSNRPMRAVENTVQIRCENMVLIVPSTKLTCLQCRNIFEFDDEFKLELGEKVNCKQCGHENKLY